VARAQSLERRAELSALINAVLTAMILLLVLIATLAVARSLVGPLRKLKEGALNVATVQLPERVRQLGEEREAILAVTIPERPGSFREFCKLLGKRSITEFNYRYADAKIAHIFVGIEVANRRETTELLRAMHKRRIEAYDMSDNEMAKLHVRHLVGGHAPAAEHEILYRFEFPERPGALMQFLNSMSRGWNISLFHYRNHGADYGRVLVGMQVPPQDHAEFQNFLQRLGYRCVDESGNPAYRMFLGR